jgi:broad specificity phosphatase PhoE
VDWRKVRDLESQEDLQIRARNFYQEFIRKTPPDKTTLVVGHAGTIKALTSVLLNIHYDKIWDMDTPKNCSLSLFEINNEDVKVIRLNDISHLESLH